MKKKINIPLIIVTIIIWGIIVYSISQTVWFNASEEKGEVMMDNDSFDLKKNISPPQPFVFELLEKDPFDLAYKKSVVEVKKIRIPIKLEAKREIPLIRFSVGGIVINGDRNKIVLNDETNSNVVFLKEGDLYQGLKVIKVTKNHVEFLQISSGNKLMSSIQ